jgi:hypothetical protein
MGNEVFDRFSANMNCSEIGTRNYVNQSIDIAPRVEASFNCKGVSVTEFLKNLRKDATITNLDAGGEEFYSEIKYISLGCSVGLNRTNMERMSTFADAPVNIVYVAVAYCK